MKKVCFLLLCVLLVLSLCACTESEQPYTFKKGYDLYTVDPAAGTITDGRYIYNYTFTGHPDEYHFNVTFPDGSTYNWNKSERMESGGGSKDYDPGRYADGEILLEAVLDGNSEPLPMGNIFPAVLLIAVGVWYALSPHSVWYISFGWRYKNAEPSDAALTFYKITGTVLIIFGILVFVLSFSQ